MWAEVFSKCAGGAAEGALRIVIYHLLWYFCLILHSVLGGESLRGSIMGLKMKELVEGKGRITFVAKRSG